MTKNVQSPASPKDSSADIDHQPLKMQVIPYTIIKLSDPIKSGSKNARESMALSNNILHSIKKGRH